MYELFRKTGVSKGMLDITILLLVKSYSKWGTANFLQKLYDLAHRYTRSTGDIHHCTAGAITLGSTNIGLDDVGNISKVTCLMPISIDMEWFMADDGLTKAMEGHVWALARSVDSEVAQ